MAEVEASSHGRSFARAAAFGAAVLAVFLLALTAGIVAAPISGPTLLTVLLKAFVVCVMGGIGVACLVLAWRSARGETAPVSAVPKALCTQCPACGESIAAQASCVRCGHPLVGIEERWHTNEKTSLTAIAFMAVLGAGLSALGLFVGIGPMFDGVPLFAAVGYVALGLLLFVVGGMFVYGAVLLVRDALFGRATWTYAWAAKTETRTVHVRATAKLEGGRILRIDGERDELSVPSAARTAPTPGASVRLSETQRGFVLAALLLHAAGLLAFAHRTKEAWTGGVADGEGSASRTQSEALLTVALEGIVPPELAALYGAFAVRARVDVPFADVWRAVRDDASLCERLLAAVASHERALDAARVVTALETGLGAALARDIGPSVLN
jgi:hypothetical protein